MALASFARGVWRPRRRRHQSMHLLSSRSSSRLCRMPWRFYLFSAGCQVCGKCLYNRLVYKFFIIILPAVCVDIFSNRTRVQRGMSWPCWRLSSSSRPSMGGSHLGFAAARGASSGSSGFAFMPQQAKKVEKNFPNIDLKLLDDFIDYNLSFLKLKRQWKFSKKMSILNPLGGAFWSATRLW